MMWRVERSVVVCESLDASEVGSGGSAETGRGETQVSNAEVDLVPSATGEMGKEMSEDKKGGKGEERDERPRLIRESREDVSRRQESQ